jgi:hypothetical protein
MSFFRANLIGLKADRDKKEIGTGPPRLNLGYAHQDCGTRSLVIKITRTAVQYHAWTAVQCARWIASPPALMDSLNGLSHHRLRLPSSAARADGHSTCHRGWTAMPQTQAAAELPSPALASTNCQVRSPHLVTRLPAAAEHGRPAPTLRLIFHMDSGGAVHRWRRGARRPQHARGQPLLGGQTYLPFEISNSNF